MNKRAKQPPYRLFYGRDPINENDIILGLDNLNEEYNKNVRINIEKFRESARK